jgi:hypothetical protein
MNEGRGFMRATCRSDDEGFKDRGGQVPKGTAENMLLLNPGQSSVVPSGLVVSRKLYPGLRPGLRSAVPTGLNT